MLKCIAVTNLRIGMFIHEFCGAWMDHPFWKSKFLLKTEKDLQRITSSSITELWIDTSKGLDVVAGVARVSTVAIAADAESTLLAALHSLPFNLAVSM